MNIVFIGSVYPLDRENEIRQNSKCGLDNASNNFQWALLAGLDFYYPDIKIITQPAIRTYPLKYKKIFFKNSSFSHKIGSNDYCIGFINIPIVKHFVKTFNLFRRLQKTIDPSIETTVIVYAVHSPYLKALVELKKKNVNLKICLIVPDLPQFMSENRNPIYRILKNIDSILINKYLKSVDSFVLLSDYMAETLKVENRPWTRVEGIFEQSYFIDNIPKKESKTILYTGTLAYQYGIINLMTAFNAIKDSDYNLWICGEGDCRDEIEKRTKSDSRIKYFGQQPRSIVLTLQKKATLLINPRTSEGEYTKYSFPSKTMEYLASGTPCVLFKLQGIPEEYYKYCYVVNNENIDDLKEMIMNVCSKDQSELDDFGKRASQFILQNKNPITQVKKIYEMINKV